MSRIPDRYRWHDGKARFLTYAIASTTPRSPKAQREREGFYRCPPETIELIDDACRSVECLCGLAMVRLSSAAKADVLWCMTTTMRPDTSGYTDAVKDNDRTREVVWLKDDRPELIVHELSHVLGFEHGDDADASTVSNCKLLGGEAFTPADERELVRVYGPPRELLRRRA